MKYLFITILLTLSSCVDKKEKTVMQTADAEPQKLITQEKSEKQELQSIFYNNDKNLKTFDFNQLPLSKDIDDISNNDTEKYNVNQKLRKDILEQENYYKLVNYSNILDNKKFRVFTVFGNYDYYTNLLLVITKIDDDTLIDYKIIASIMGDADDMTEISTSFLDSISFKVITKKKRLTEKDNFETLSVDNKIYKITSNGQIE
mgnify:CR=1 FL=1